MGSGHMVFANRHSSGHLALTNRGINVQTDTNQDQGCEGAGGTSGITNACTATSGRASTQTSTQMPVTLTFLNCVLRGPHTPPPVTFRIDCNTPHLPNKCNNIGCQTLTCVGPTIPDIGNCVTDNGVQLTSCLFHSPFITFSCTRTETHSVPGTGTTQSGGVSG